MGLGDGGLKCVKYLLIVFDLIFCLIGLGILGIGVFLFVSGYHELKGLTEHFSFQYYLAIFFIIIGLIISVLGFIGCCGGIFENRCLLVLFFVLLLFVFLILLASGLVILFMRQFVTKSIEGYVENLYSNITYYKNETDNLQSSWECCGGPKAEKDFTNRNLSIPESCKPIEGKNYVSCSEKISGVFDNAGLSFAIPVFVTAVITLLCMILSMTLCCAVTNLA